MMIINQLRVATYARYSSNNQREESIVAQENAMMKYIREKGYHFVARYADRIFTKPIIDSLLFLDIVSIMFTVSAVLVVLAYVWSILTVAKE